MNGFTTNQISPEKAEWIAIFCDVDYYYRGVLPAGSELIIARIFAEKTMKEGIKPAQGSPGVEAKDLKYCFLANRVEMITKD